MPSNSITKLVSRVPSHLLEGYSHGFVCWQDGHFEEAQLLREREVDLKRDLGGPAQVATTRFPRVSAADVEAVISTWSGVPVEQMSSDEMKRLRQLQDSLKVCCLCLIDRPHLWPQI